MWPLLTPRMWPLLTPSMWPLLTPSMWLHAAFLKLLLLVLFCSGHQDGHPQVSDGPFNFSLDSDIVHPVRVDERGAFLTFDLSPRILQKRGLPPRTAPPVYYEIRYQGVQLTFNLSQNRQLLAPGYVSEWRGGGIRDARIHGLPRSSCHMRGEVQATHQHVGSVAISTCRGLRGLFQLAEEDFLIEPVLMTMPSSGEAMPHRISRRHAAELRTEGQAAQRRTEGQAAELRTEGQAAQRRTEGLAAELRTEGQAAELRTEGQAGNRSCGVRESPNSHDKWERRRERWQQLRQPRKRRIQPRSISKEKWVETLVVADAKMVAYHGSEHVENYVLTVMNMVAGLFHDASIGNRINIVIVRLILLESEEEELKITHHADNSLRSFCKWQKSLNMKGEEHPLHHDVAVLLTRKDICAAMNRPCETLGLSHVSGMCQPHRSCNINEDTGLPTAFTVTHELGHSFGVQHDGSGNDCEPQGKRPHIMSPQLLYDTSPLIWSRCSRDYITRFLDRGWGLCLDDPPSMELLDLPSVPPGVLYDVGHQCRLQYGTYSSFCQDIDNVCNTLWCSVGSTCHSKLDAAVDGTVCGHDKWCFNGDCVPVGQQPSPEDGVWGSWSSWSSCTRSCGAGVQNAERQCTNPIPRYGGRYCLGERKRFRVCNTQSCSLDAPSFRNLQCSQFDSVPYKGKLHTWSPVPSAINPCELHCRPDDGYFSEKLLDAVTDGTPCYVGNSSRDMCINGICKNVGCDFEIDSNAVEDRCGVCHGDASACHTVLKTYEDSDGLGYVDIGLIPPGAREIRIEEVAEAGNFLALRSEDPEKYFLNGGWTIQWNGDYQAAGTTFTYSRTGDLENLTAPGPTLEPVWIQLLFQERNPGVRYQYTIKRDPDSSNEIQLPDFSWRYGTWTECSATCGSGVQRQLVHCVEKVAGLVEERYCDTLTRPDDRQRTCNDESCPPRWWAGEWQQCSATCGTGGQHKRTVLCIQRVGLDEQRALQPTDCQHLPKPEASASCNQHLPCPAIWYQGNWTQCSVTCGEGLQLREVYCLNGTEGNVCDPKERPLARRACQLSPCPPGSDFGAYDWTGSGASSKEIFNEIIPGAARVPPGPRHPLDEDNSISEGDFSSPGEGEQGKGKRAFVDDFYYDYNFINFHEDLTYDPSEDNGIAGGGVVDPRGKELSTQVPSAEEELGKTDGGKSEGSIQLVTHTPETQYSHVTTRSLHMPTSNGHNQTPGRDSTTVSPSTSAEPQNIVGDLHTVSGHPVTEPSSGDRFSSPDKNQQGPGQAHNNTDPGHQGHWGSTTEEPQETYAPDSVTSHSPLLRSLPEISTYHISQDLPGDPSPYVSPDPLQDLVQQITQQPKPGASTGLKQDLSSDPAHDLLPDPAWDPSPYPMYEPSPDPTWGLSPDAKQYPWPDPKWDPLQDVDVDHLPGTQVPQRNPTYDYLTNTTQNISPGLIENPGHSFLSSPSAEVTPNTSEDVLLDFSQDPDFLWDSPLDLSSTIESERTPAPDPTAALSWNPSTQLSMWTERDRMVRTIPHTTPSFRTVTHRSHSWSDDTDRKASITLKTQDSHVEGSPHPHLGTLTSGKGATESPSPTVTSHTTGSVPSRSNKDPQKNKWEVGNWSECSTSCGLGAIWRPVRCVANETCDPGTKPVPARRCYLRPCASWRVGNWSKCTHGCGGGVRLRDVQCVGTRDERLLRPFHCQSTVYKPRAQMPCHEQPCMEWYVSSWRECSEECGGGMQQRLVTCPETGRCDESLKPNNTRSCNPLPCTKWAVGPWGQCTASCGGGIQRRQVKCLNTRTGTAEEDNNLCDHEPWPENIQKCNAQDCDLSLNSVSCSRDRLTFSFCQTLRLLGRCSLPTVQAQCCQTCRSHSLGPRELTNQRLSRR
ncbi:A disintegrin and metalloproteinase with thrombospondin motifs 7 isoform X2 [Ascaphus truei]|uniref:A disintegrin and metalloproteinase with thrombospondin motifs 7 isoform X2 n=1 Tax=Ascaphus truei TaxID=8439 RepID=UPI003F5AB125